MHPHESRSMHPLHSNAILAGSTARQMTGNEFHVSDYHLNLDILSGFPAVVDFLVFQRDDYHLNTTIAQLFWRKIHQECRKVVYEQDSGPENEI